MKGPKCPLSNGHFGTSAELSWVRNVQGPKCPYSPPGNRSSFIEVSQFRNPGNFFVCTIVNTIIGDTQTLEQKLSWLRLASGDGNAATNVPEKCRCLFSYRAYMSPSLQVEQNILIAQRCVLIRSFAVLGVNGDCAGSIDARCRWLMARVSAWTCEVPHQAPAVWPWHQCQAIWTLAIIPRQARRLAGISAAASARFISLTALSREWRPADRRHDRPWTPYWWYWSTFSPQTYWWGAQIGAPRRSAVAMRNDERRVAFLQMSIAFDPLSFAIQRGNAVSVVGTASKNRFISVNRIELFFPESEWTPTDIAAMVRH